ncbi:MAG: aminotransferase class V-fold PLP-dependent enzyme [Deltaproteobacteria bacterium]|nr:aminotransferase class V-fold PLP-dependent enzyme [Deltaproteobacteria bacterium]
MAKPDIEDIRKHFPITNNHRFFNHASISPMPFDVADAIKEFNEDIMHHGNMHERRWIRQVEKTREMYARLINAEPEEIAFIKSTSQAISIICKGMKFRKGEKILTADVEFPANIYPWMAMTPKGVEIKFVGAKDGRIDPRDIEKSIDAKTKIVALSLVEYGSGFRNYVEEIGEICKKKGIFFYLDGIQGIGAIPVDVKKFNVDFMSTAASKWLFGPHGVAILYIRKDIINEIGYEEVSWRSVIEEESRKNFRMDTKAFARKFEGDNANFSGIIGFGAALKFREGIGNNVIYRLLSKNVDLIFEELKRRKYLIFGPVSSSERAGIISVTHPEFSCEELVARLLAENIIVSIRNNHLRISPHFYQTEEEIEFLFEVLP